MSPRTCPYCGEALSPLDYSVRERMLATGRAYAYHECLDCGARVIDEVPVDLAESYPATYGVPRSDRSRDKLRAFARLGPVPRDARIVDVGASHGAFLFRLAERGHTQLLGVDPFAPMEIVDGSVTIERGTLADLPDGSADVITMHHVLEHVAEPLPTFVDLARVLAPTGCVLLRVPLADSWAARQYGPDWIQHDAPRHLTLPTTRGLRALAARASLRVDATWRDEGGWQAWAGAQVATGNDPWRASAWRVRAGIARHAVAAAIRNWRGVGDQGAFVLRR